MSMFEVLELQSCQNEHLKMFNDIPNVIAHFEGINND